MCLFEKYPASQQFSPREMTSSVKTTPAGLLTYSILYDIRERGIWGRGSSIIKSHKNEHLTKSKLDKL